MSTKIFQWEQAMAHRVRRRYLWKQGRPLAQWGAFFGVVMWTVVGGGLVSTVDYGNGIAQRRQMEDALHSFAAVQVDATLEQGGFLEGVD